MSRKHKVLRVTGGRVAYTNTSRVADKEVERAIRAVAREINLDGVIVHVKKYGRGNYGRAYSVIPSIANTDGLNEWEWRYLITVTDAHFVGTLAHEAAHIEQFRERKPVSETRANNFAYHFEGSYGT